ncbi:MAG: phage terminase large subunit family protein [Immundisolibacterales bacterium]|nr:phage terminase large subunit family protein [Immundisolibacterales bacterium]
MTWPDDESAYGPEHFEGICSETLERVVDKRTGRTRLQWKKIGRANEPLDLLVYSLACVSHLGVPFLLGEAELIQQARSAHERLPHAA